MKNINVRTMDYVVLVQTQKISVNNIPEDIKTDVIEILSFLQNGETKTQEISTQVNVNNEVKPNEA